MNKKNNLSPLMLMIVVLGALGCATFIVVSLLDAMPGFQKSKCESPPNLTTANLVGTWVAGLSNESDSLILREDNKYKQIIVSKRRNINYQTDWQDWRLERDNSGLVHLHLKGMRMCGGFNLLRSCEDVDYNGYDFCQDRSILMKGEGILLVLNDDPSAGFDLFFPLGSENTWVYRFLKP